MTQEDKNILLKVLCEMLPYGVKVWYPNGSGAISTVKGIVDGICYFNENPRYGGFCRIEMVKPYLRPISSMTEEEIEEYRNLSDEVIGSYGPYHREFIAHCVRLGIKPDNPHECIDDFLNMEAIDWLNAHHFDYRGLIEKGLALEAPDGMYKTE